MEYQEKNVFQKSQGKKTLLGKIAKFRENYFKNVYFIGLLVGENRTFG